MQEWKLEKKHDRHYQICDEDASEAVAGIHFRRGYDAAWCARRARMYFKAGQMYNRLKQVKRVLVKHGEYGLAEEIGKQLDYIDDKPILPPNFGKFPSAIKWEAIVTHSKLVPEQQLIRLQEQHNALKESLKAIVAKLEADNAIGQPGTSKISPAKEMGGKKD